MRVTIANQTISKLITNLEAIKHQYGDLPICSQGNEAPQCSIYLTPLTDDSTDAKDASEAKKLLLDIY